MRYAMDELAPLLHAEYIQIFITISTIKLNLRKGNTKENIEKETEELFGEENRKRRTRQKMQKKLKE